MNTAAQTKTIRSVERAIDVLDALSRSNASQTVPELEKILSLNRPTLYRVLDTLVSKGLVSETGDPRRFMIASRMVEFARPWLGRNSLLETAQSDLNRLRDQTGETIALFSAVDGKTKLCVQELPSSQALVFKRGAGFAEPLTIGSSGKAILAFLDNQQIEQNIGLIGNKTEESALRDEILGIRKQGYSLSKGEIIEGAVAMAAPLFDRDGIVQGCVSLFGPAVRLTGDHLESSIQALKISAEAISAALGYQKPAAAE